MARVKTVRKSRKQHECGRGHPIAKGDDYYTAAPGFRARPKYRCMAHPFRPSELTTSARSEPLAAIESFEDSLTGLDSHEELETAWDELKSAFEEYLALREEALEAWEHGNSQLEELRDTAQSALDEIEGHQVEEFDEDEPSATDEDAFAEWDERRREHLDEQADEALSVAQSVEV